MNLIQQRPPTRRSKGRVWLSLLIAVIVGYLVHLLWPLARQRFAWLPGMGSDQVLAILAIAFAVVQFIDARAQEQELNSISGDLKVETANLKTQIEAITKQASQLHVELQDITKDLGHQSEVLRDQLTVIASNLKEQSGGLKDISGSISTRFVGPFPENMQEIISLLQSAKRKVEIVVDFPGYGQYSALRSHVEYTEALTAARQDGADVQIICYQLPLVQKERLEQFPDITPEQFSKKMTDKKFIDYFAFFKGIRLPTDSAGLRETFTARDQSLIRELGDRGIDWKFHPEPAAFFLWMVDESEAIFTFKNVGRKDVGLSFRTHDGNLIKQFREIFMRRWANARANYDPAVTP